MVICAALLFYFRSLICRYVTSARTHPKQHVGPSYDEVLFGCQTHHLPNTSEGVHIYACIADLKNAILLWLVQDH